MSTIQSIRSFRSLNSPQAVSHPAVIGTDLVGIEIELENVGGVTFSSSYWDNKTDGSLRNGGREFVFSRPLGGASLIEAISEITTVLARHNPDQSWRCSTHVHMNIRDMEVHQLKKLILAYTVFEKVLFKCGAMNRYKSNFCLPYDVAKQSLDTLGNIWDKQNGFFLSALSRNWCKYSSLNLLPVYSIGSVELRIGNAEVTLDRLLAMCNRLLLLKQIAMSWEGEDDSEFVKFLAETPFHNLFNKSVCLDYEVSQSDISEGLINAFHVINCKSLRLSQHSPNHRFSIRLAEATVTELGSYIRRSYGEEEESIFNDIDMESATFDDVVFMTNHTPFSANSLLSDSDMAIYNIMMSSGFDF